MESHPSPIYFLTSQECSWLQKPWAAAEHASSPPLAWPPDSLELAPASAPGVKHLHRANQEMGSTTVHLLFMKESLIENMPEKRDTGSWKSTKYLGVRFTEIKWQLWIHAQTSWGLGCDICSRTHFPGSQRGQVRIPAHCSSWMEYLCGQLGSPFARENDYSESRKCIRVNRKGTK